MKLLTGGAALEIEFGRGWGAKRLEAADVLSAQNHPMLVARLGSTIANVSVGISQREVNHAKLG